MTFQEYLRQNSLFRAITLPLTRVVFPKLIAADIVSVQPMTAPTGVTRFFSMGNRYKSLKEFLARPREETITTVPQAVHRPFILYDTMDSTGT